MRTKPPVILIVEDDLNDQYLIKQAFNKVNGSYPVHMVGDGVEALAYLKGERQYADRVKYPRPTVLLVDLKMPKMNGFELLLFLQKNINFMVVPTIVFSSSIDPNDVTNAFLLGANAYHVKPSSFDEMCAQLKIMHEYWTTCELPEFDTSGRLMETQGGGKLSEQTLKLIQKAA